MTLTAKQNEILNSVAADIGVLPLDLYNLIYFESKFNPTAKNINSSARGILQFIDSTARDLGYENSLDLVTKNPTIEQQLNSPVRDYLNKYKPYPTLQSLHMAVFYPAAQYWPPDKKFPANVTLSNPGIKTPADYMTLAAKGGSVLNPLAKIDLKKLPTAALLIAGAVLIYLFTKDV